MFLYIKALSASILWNRHLGNINEAERLLQFVLEEILPKMDKKNVHNTVMLILPVVKVMKEDGKFEEARQLFENHVCRNFALYFGDDGTTPCLVIFKPIMYLLDVNMYGEDMPNLNEVIEWAAGDDNGVATDSLDGAISFYSLHCLMAQLCLELSRLTNDEANKNKLQQKSITLARKTFDKSIDEENERVRFPMAFGDCEWILTELDNEYKPGTYAVVDSKQQEQSELFQPSV